MRIEKKKYGFTLIELIISMVVVCILFVVLLSTYSWISRIGFRIEQERNVYQEILQLSQLFQNITDNNDVDFDAYNIGSPKLLLNSGIVDVLYLSGKSGKIKIFSSGLCLENVDDNIGFTGSYCNIYIEDNGRTETLLNNKVVNITKPYFKIIPFASEQQYIDDISTLCPSNNYINCINKHGFWLLVDFYNLAHKRRIWELNVHMPIQRFFSFNF